MKVLGIVVELLMLPIRIMVWFFVITLMALANLD